MLIELRIKPGKLKLVRMINKISKKCHLSSRKIHRIPHITIYGPFKGRGSNIRSINQILAQIGSKYGPLEFQVKGFEWMQGEHGKVIYFNIIPSPDLIKIQKELAFELSTITPSNKEWDKFGKYTFHSTLAYRLTDSEFKRVWSYVNSVPNFKTKVLSYFGIISPDRKFKINDFHFPMTAFRITFLNDYSKIISEYDFVTHHILNRYEALNPKEWSKTLWKYRINRGIELSNNISSKSSSGPYIISDTHFGHENIIEYCIRPFSSIHEMNRVLISNWNRIVKPNDIVYFLGDLSFGRSKKPPSYWLNQLNGDIRFIRGNHDDLVLLGKKHEYIDFEGEKILLVHDPKEKPKNWSGWIIHGHNHNNDLSRYPLVNNTNKTINVSSELINYSPISLKYLLSFRK